MRTSNKPARAYRLGPATQTAQFRCGVHTAHTPGTEREFLTPQYAAVYVHEGRGWYEDEGGRRPLAPGSVFQRFPGRIHAVGMETAYTRCFIAVPSQVADLFGLTGRLCPDRPVFRIDPDPELPRRFARLAARLEATPETELDVYLLAAMALLRDLLTRDRAPRPSRRPAQIADALRILDSDLGAPLAMPDVARAVHMSYSTFRRRFREATGTSPGDYRIRRRIERAMVLLAEQDDSMERIADALGYADVYAFAAQFRKIAGLPPGAWRRQNRG